jgi:superfamily I DNA/RNA helicase
MSQDTWWIDEEQLDDDQNDVVALSPSGSYLVVGPPGSGKTNLLLLRASYLVDAGKPNVAVLMFTRTLREFVVDGTSNYSVAPEKIRTITSWEQTLLREHGIVVSDRPFPELRIELAARLAELFEKKPALTGHLDCVLVDEVQDCLPQEIDLFTKSARNVFFVGDDRQQIYEDHKILDVLASRVTKKSLTKHYRNGEAICKVADAIGKTFGEDPLLPHCNYDETKGKSSVNFEQCATAAEVCEKLSTRLRSQLTALS